MSVRTGNPSPSRYDSWPNPLAWYVVSWIASHALFGGLWMADLQTAVLAGRHLTPQEVLDILLRDLRNIWPVLLVYYIIAITVQTGLGYGAIASAYKAVTETEAPA